MGRDRKHQRKPIKENNLAGGTSPGADHAQQCAPSNGERPCGATMYSRDITLGSDSVYRWAYDLNLLTNPTIYFVVCKLFIGITAVFFVLDVLISMGKHDFWSAVLPGLVKGFGLFLLGMLVLALMGYLVYAMMMGGKYCVLFEMDEHGVTHTQLPKQFKKAQAIAAITALTAKRVGTVGTAILAGSKSSAHSEWRLVKRISCHPLTHVIKVNAPLNKNQVYASKEDFAFVRDYIISHCPNARIRG